MARLNRVQGGRENLLLQLAQVPLHLGLPGARREHAGHDDRLLAVKVAAAAMGRLAPRHSDPSEPPGLRRAARRCEDRSLPVQSLALVETSWPANAQVQLQSGQGVIRRVEDGGPLCRLQRVLGRGQTGGGPSSGRASRSPPQGRSSVGVGGRNGPAETERLIRDRARGGQPNDSIAIPGAQRVWASARDLPGVRGPAHERRRTGTAARLAPRSAPDAPLRSVVRGLTPKFSCKRVK